MRHHFHKVVLSIALGALLVGTIALTPGGSSVKVNAAAVQNENEATQAEFKNSLAFSKESIEADPRAPDDRVPEEEVKAATADAKAAAVVAPSGIGAFIPIPVPLPGGIDYVANGAATRNVRQSTIRLRGACPGSIPVAAFLYWGVIMQAPPAFQVVTVSRNCAPPIAVLGTLIAVSPPPNDSPVPPAAGSLYALYRSNVLGTIGPGINGDYMITGIPTSNATGADPWLCGIVGQAAPRSEGTSLVVLFTGPIPPAARVYINEGAVLMAPPNLNWQIFNPLTIPIPPHQMIKHTRIGGDGQVGRSTFSVLPIATERTFIGPNFFGPFLQLRGPGSPFNGDSDWNGTDGESLTQLWDTHTSSIGANNTFLPVGAFGYWIQYLTNGDNIVPNVHVLGVR